MWYSSHAFPKWKEHIAHVRINYFTKINNRADAVFGTIHINGHYALWIWFALIYCRIEWKIDWIKSQNFVQTHEKPFKSFYFDISFLFPSQFSVNIIHNTRPNHTSSTTYTNG